MQERRASIKESLRQAVTRIEVEELEAWYFADWSAVHAAYPRVSKNIPAKSCYRDPDAIMNGTCGKFEKILQKHGYFRQGLAKVEATTAIGKHFDPCTSNSHSFRVFRDAIAEAII